MYVKYKLAEFCDELDGCNAGITGDSAAETS